MKEIIYFIITFLIVYLIYYFASIRKAKQDKNKLPIEVQYLILCYELDIKKIPYRNFLNTIAIVASFDVALTVTLVSLIKEIVWQILFGFVFIVPIIVISFTLVGKYYKKYQENNSVIEKSKNKKKENKK